MTTPEERQRAQTETRNLLRQLCTADLTPGLPDRLRHQAEGVLRHLASPSEIRDILEMALGLLHAQQERDQYRAAALTRTRRSLAKWLLALALTFAAGLLAGRWAFS